MKTLFYRLYPRLKPFDFDKHYESHLRGLTWVLMNSIKDKRVVYSFSGDNILEILEGSKSIKTTWKHITTNFLAIKNEDGEQLISLYFKGDNILIINKKGTDDYAFFINESQSENTLNTEKDIKDFLRNHYTKKASKLIEGHKFYYIQNSKEHGPFTAKELAKKVQQNLADSRCFVRELGEYSYNRRLRIKDLLREIQS